MSTEADVEEAAVDEMPTEEAMQEEGGVTTMILFKVAETSKEEAEAVPEEETKVVEAKINPFLAVTQQKIGKTCHRRIETGYIEPGTGLKQQEQLPHFCVISQTMTQMTFRVLLPQLQILAMAKTITTPQDATCLKSRFKALVTS